MARIDPAEVRALSGLLDELDYYQLLEIERGAPASAIKRAYYAASRRFHPDHNRALQGSDRDALKRVSKRVAEAYQVLRDARRRKSYDGQLAGEDGKARIQLVAAQNQAGKEALDAALGKTPNGRRFFGLARGDLDRGDLASAQRNLKMALTFEPANEGFKRKLGEIEAALKAQAPKNPHAIR